ncbi:MAG: type II secretion system protein [Bacilli bacterium]
MNKKGFTLVEILVTLVILGIIVLLVSPKILNVLDKTHQDAYNNQKKLIESTAVMYAGENKKNIEFVDGTSQITLLQLANEGYIELPVKNYLLDENYNENTTITITKHKNYYTAVLND